MQHLILWGAASDALAGGLHLMGGCAIGNDERTSVVNEAFQVHGMNNLYIADSSVFPDAPGINPSLTIMALSHQAAASILRQNSMQSATSKPTREAVL